MSLTHTHVCERRPPCPKPHHRAKLRKRMLWSKSSPSLVAPSEQVVAVKTRVVCCSVQSTCSPHHGSCGGHERNDAFPRRGSELRAPRPAFAFDRRRLPASNPTLWYRQTLARWPARHRRGVRLKSRSASAPPRARSRGLTGTPVCSETTASCSDGGALNRSRPSGCSAVTGNLLHRSSAATRARHGSAHRRPARADSRPSGSRNNAGLP